MEGKFEPGAIRITVRRTEGNVELVVEDDGAGMDEAALDRLERALHRGEAHPEDPDGVAGVGLRNVQRRIRLYYGDMPGNSGGISISSRKGEGTAVRITIPAIMEGKRS
jgi:two-component system sensor histidine kinase YesM